MFESVAASRCFGRHSAAADIGCPGCGVGADAGAGPCGDEQLQQDRQTDDQAGGLPPLQNCTHVPIIGQMLGKFGISFQLALSRYRDTAI